MSDITYLPTDEGFHFLAVTMDLFSRRVVGWATAPTLETPLVAKALERAIALRGKPAGLIHHSDRGCQYASHAYRDALQSAGITPSMSRKGNCYDNAKAEAFFSTLKSECLPATQVFESKAVARRELFEYIEIYYNNQRLHSALGYQAPRRFEAEHFKKENNFFEENVAATSSQKRNEVQRE